MQKPPGEPEVGARLRVLRERRGLSLRALSAQCGLSINAISKIERGESSPTLSSLHQLAVALGVSITDLFEDEGHEVAVVTRAERRRTFAGNGLTMENLASGLADQQIEPFLVTIQPGERTGVDAVVHEGQEFAYCLSGQIEYTVNGVSYQLWPSDGLLLDSSQPHSFRNPGETEAVVLLVFQASEGRHVARRRHLDL